MTKPAAIVDSKHSGARRRGVSASEHVIASIVPHSLPQSDQTLLLYSPGTPWRICETVATAILFVVAIHHDLGPQVLPASTAAALVVIALAYLAMPALVYAVRFFRTPIRAMMSSGIGVGQSGHIYCWGWLDEIARLQAAWVGELREPIIVRRMHNRIPDWLWVCWHVPTACIAMYIVIFMAQWAWIVFFPLILFSTEVIRFLAWAISGIRPRYYRVAPGCIEMLVASPMGSDIRVTRRVSLESCYALIRYDSRWVEIKSHATHVSVFATSLEGLSASHEFAEGIVWAIASLGRIPAVSPPEDSLSG